MCIVPTQSPQGFSGNSASSSSLYFSWTPPLPEHQNGHIISYSISVIALDTGSTQQYSVSTTDVTITGLSPFTTYTCVVAARTSVGVGPVTSVVTVTTNEDGNASLPSS